MVILSVDYGDARTGIAVCDKNSILASPVCVIKERYEPKLIEQIAELVEEYAAEEIVVGKPVNMDGTLGCRAQRCIEFAGKLADRIGIKVSLYDERLTTVAAHRALSVTNTRGAARKNVVDALSAQIILQDYIDSIKK